MTQLALNPSEQRISVLEAQAFWHGEAAVMFPDSDDLLHVYWASHGYRFYWQDKEMSRDEAVRLVGEK